MSRRLSLYLADIINSVEKIQKYTANLTYENLCEDEIESFMLHMRNPFSLSPCPLVSHL